MPEDRRLVSQELAEFLLSPSPCHLSSKHLRENVCEDRKLSLWFEQKIAKDAKVRKLPILCGLRDLGVCQILLTAFGSGFAWLCRGGFSRFFVVKPAFAGPALSLPVFSITPCSNQP